MSQRATFPVLNWLQSCIVLSAAAAVSACGGSDQPTFKPLELNVAHINDHHSQLDAFAATELTLDGVATQTELGGFARQTAMFKSVAGTKNLLKIHKEIGIFPRVPTSQL